MRHLPSIEALTAADDRQLLAELEICHVLEKLARVRAFVDLMAARFGENPPWERGLSLPGG